MAMTTVAEKVEISVLTPCFNTGSLIEDLADSLSNQTFKNFEWCIADDGSDGETRQFLTHLSSSCKFPIHVQYFEKRGGNFCRNQAFRASTGRFVKFVDADDVLELDLLEKQFEVANENPSDLVLSPTKVLMANRDSFVVPLDPALKFGPLKSYLRNATFMHGGCLLPRHLVSLVGGWDESLHAGQDLDFFRRVLITNPAVQFADSLFVYRQHDKAPRISNLTAKDQRKFEGHLAALDNFCSLLEAENALADYAVELAKNYDLWGMKAIALDIPFAASFFERAQQLSPGYCKSGSRYSKWLRSIIGDRRTAKLIRSSLWRIIHSKLTSVGLWRTS